MKSCLLVAIVLLTVFLVVDSRQHSGVASPVVDGVSGELNIANNGGARKVPDDTSETDPAAEDFIDGHGALDIERWGRILVDRDCSTVMRPDVHSVIDVLTQRYASGEVDAAIFLSGVYGCGMFSDNVDYQLERMDFWAKEAASHDLVQGHYAVALHALNQLMGYMPGMPKPGPEEARRLAKTWHDAASSIFELTGDPTDVWALASSYAHTYGPLFDEEKARYWLGEWSEVAPAPDVARVGMLLIDRGQGGYRNSALGAAFVLHAANDGYPDALQSLLDFLATCEGPLPEEGLPSIQEVHAVLVDTTGNSVPAAVALATGLARDGDYTGAYAALVEAQYLQQARHPEDSQTLQALAQMAEHVRGGNTVQAKPAVRECDPQSTFPDDERDARSVEHN